MINIPIFIGGQMKSGTTMFRMMLSRHTNIYSGLETYWFLDDLYINFNVLNNKSIIKLQGFYNVSNSDIKKIIKVTNNNKKPFVHNFFNHILSTNSKKRWLEKTPDNLKYLNLINENWKEYKFIHVLRDFRDIYASWKLSNKYDLNYFINQVHTSYEPNLYILGKETDQYQEVKYENIIVNRNYEVRRNLSFLGEHFETKCTELDIKNSKKEFETVYKFSGKKSNTLISNQEKINNNKIGHYKTVLSNEEVFIIEKELKNYFKLFEYEI